jgi:hypothetical protein
VYIPPSPKIIRQHYNFYSLHDHWGSKSKKNGVANDLQFSKITIPSILYILYIVSNLQSNRMFSFKQHCNIVPRYCNFDSQIALAICNWREQMASWNPQNICKQSPWLDYKKEESTNPVAQTIWLAFPLSYGIVQSEALFTNLLWSSTCNLFALVANC